VLKDYKIQKYNISIQKKLPVFTTAAFLFIIPMPQSSGKSFFKNE